MISAEEKPPRERKTCVRRKFDLIPNAAATSETENDYSTLTALSVFLFLCFYNYFVHSARTTSLDDNTTITSDVETAQDFRLEFPPSANAPAA